MTADSASVFSVVDRRGGYHPRILSSAVDEFLDSKVFNRRLRKMKVGASIQIPFMLDERKAKALQERIWRLNENKSKEFRTFVSKKTRGFFVFRLA